MHYSYLMQVYVPANNVCLHSKFRTSKLRNLFNIILAITCTH